MLQQQELHSQQLQQQYHQQGSRQPQMMFYQTNTDHLNEVPCLEDLDTDYKFDVVVPMEEKDKKLWYYEANSKCLFVKVDQPLTAIVSCRHIFGSPLYVRLMPVYTSLAEVRKPVNRCMIHKERCKKNHRGHVVHCTDESSDYVGNEAGEKFIDRLSVRIPLRKSQSARPPSQLIREEICFSITCLNSCTSIARRPTALIFTLENNE